MATSQRSHPDPDPFRCEMAHREDRWVIALFGELDLAAVPECDAAMEIVQRGPDAVTVDLRGLTFMDSSGVQLIVTLLAAARERRFPLTFVRGTARVQRLLAICGVEPLLTVCDASEVEAPSGSRRNFKVAG